MCKLDVDTNVGDICYTKVTDIPGDTGILQDTGCTERNRIVRIFVRRIFYPTGNDPMKSSLLSGKKASEPCVGSMNECTKRLLPVRDALDILSGKWKLPIIISLSFGDKRFKVIQREIEGITAKMLSKELKELEANQLVKRTVYDTSPVTVEYSMMPYGKSLRKVIEELDKWGAQHRKRIIAASKK